MVVNSSVSKLKSLSMVDGLDLCFDGLSILSPSSKLATDVEPGHGAGDSEEDTESFNEEDCLFMDGGDGDDELKEGAFCHYSKVSAWRKFPRSRPNSLCLQSNSVCHQQENDISSDLSYLHSSDDILHMRPPADMHPGRESFASYDDRSLPLEIAASSPNTATGRRIRRAKKSSLSVRENLLAGAWERKRELMLFEEVTNFKERAKPELLGRSSSDCGKLIADAQAPSELRRSRTGRSLTDDDFEELRGCIDLGFRFDQSSIPDLCDTLPALEVYCAVAQNLQDSPNCMSLNSPVIQSPARCSSPSPTTSWRISSPGDDPKDVKGRLRHWAQAVACNAKLCY